MKAPWIYTMLWVFLKDANSDQVKTKPDSPQRLHDANWSLPSKHTKTLKYFKSLCVILWTTSQHHMWKFWTINGNKFKYIQRKFELVDQDMWLIAVLQHAGTLELNDTIGQQLKQCRRDELRKDLFDGAFLNPSHSFSDLPPLWLRFG